MRVFCYTYLTSSRNSLATGTPAVLVPSPNVTADHQTKNARALADVGAALLLPEADLDARFTDTVVALLADPAQRADMRREALAIAWPDAALHIARAVLALAPEASGDGSASSA